MKRNLGRAGSVLASLCLLLVASYCGNNGGGKAVLVTITSPTTAQTIPANGTLPITAAVMNTKNLAVTWTVNGIANGNSTYGTITGSGMSVIYTAPAAVPSTATFNIIVTSVADTSQSASLSVTISAGVVVSISTPSSPQSLSVSSTLDFTANVTRTTNTGVTWTVNGVANGNASFGTIAGTGLSVTYTAPPTVPTPATFNITATSTVDNTKSASVSVTITPGVGIIMTTPIGAQSLPANSALGFTVSVVGTLNTAVTWTVNGVAGGDSTFGKITGTGLSVTYTSPGAVPSPATFNVTATSQADNTKSVSISVTITAAVPLACGSGNESNLSGQYAFLLRGFNHNGFNAAVGSITVDGSGHITAGELDMNSTGALAATNTTVTASPSSFYSVGPDNRGCATIVTASGTTLKTRFDLGVVALGTATQGKLMEFDPANSGAFIATGQLFQQNSSDFIVLQGGAYVHLLTGWDSTKGRMVCGGVHTNSGGNISNSEQTCNDAGTVTTTGPIVGSSGSYPGMDANGRFTETVGSTHFANYFVSEVLTTGVPAILSVTTDTNPVLAGEAIFQTQNTYSQSSVVGDYAIYANGVNNSTSGKIFLSFATSDGSSKLTLNTYDENDGGSWLASGTARIYTYSVDYVGGVSLTTPGPINAGHLYLTGGTLGIYIGADAGAFAGFAAAQTGSGSLSNTSLHGTFFGGATEIVNQSATAECDLAILNGDGDVSVTADDSSTSSQAAEQLSAQTIIIAPNGTFATNTDPTQVIGIMINPNFFVVSSNTGSSYPAILWLTLNAPPI
jgi:hypothetical protein